MRLKNGHHHPPAVFFYNVDGDPNDPARKKNIEDLRKKNEQMYAARQKWNADQKLYFLRLALIEQCVTFYSHKPYNTDELEKYAREMLKGHDDAIDEILTKVRERVPKGDK